jgi:hypothetical protein
MTQQDYDNTLKRYNELLPESQKYFRDFGPPDPNDPTRNEMNVLGQRLEAWQAMPGNGAVYRTMGGGEGPGGFTGQNQDPNFGQLGTIGAGPYGNRGSGQPINQPMGIQIGDNPNQPVNMGMSPSQPTSFPLGSLQSLGGSIPGSTTMAANAGDWNGQGTMGGGFVSLRGPDGSMKQVPADQLSHWLSRGAVRA